jgi:hypothetical protein
MIQAGKIEVPPWLPTRLPTRNFLTSPPFFLISLLSCLQDGVLASLSILQKEAVEKVENTGRR